MLFGLNDLNWYKKLCKMVLQQLFFFKLLHKKKIYYLVIILFLTKLYLASCIHVIHYTHVISINQIRTSLSFQRVRSMSLQRCSATRASQGLPCTECTTGPTACSPEWNTPQVGDNDLMYPTVGMYYRPHGLQPGVKYPTGRWPDILYSQQ